VRRTEEVGELLPQLYLHGLAALLVIIGALNDGRKVVLVVASG
jgi:hypothetical protein